eukprot:375788_1
MRILDTTKGHIAVGCWRFYGHNATTSSSGYIVAIHCKEKQFEYTLNAAKHDWDESMFQELQKGICKEFNLVSEFGLVDNNKVDIDDMDDLSDAFDDQKTTVHLFVNHTSMHYAESPHITVDSVQSTSAIVRFANIKVKYECAVELCDNYGDDNDEKKNIIWKQICLVKDRKEYNISDLKDDMNHGIRARYKNEHSFGEWCKALIFKTKKKVELTQIKIQSSILKQAEVLTLSSLFRQSRKQLSKRWNLLYRGSSDGFGANIFHKKCDNKPKTLSIICTDSDNVFGGYASVPWTSEDGYKSDNDAFIFLIRSSKNYPPQMFTELKEEMKQNAVLHSRNFMCTFGGGDICIWDNCNTNTPSYVCNVGFMNIPTTYYLNGETRWFKVTDIEVFVAQ